MMEDGSPHPDYDNIMDEGAAFPDYDGDKEHNSRESDTFAAYATTTITRVGWPICLHCALLRHVARPVARRSTAATWRG